jgi:pimeloyl-ACP methyl ester carboxylesterase
MRTDVSGIEIEYETMGDPADPAMLLVMGLGAQMIAWDDEFCLGLVDRGFFVIRFDNRDVGLSTKVLVDPEIDVMTAITEAMGGATPQAPYLLADMAADAVGVLDALGIDQAHVCGASMGGMIAQSIAIARAERVLTLTSVMSTTGDADVGQPHPEVLGLLMAPPATDRAAAVSQSVAGGRAIGSPEHFDEARATEMAERSYDRCYYPAGVAHQLVAIVSSPSRSEALSRFDRPTLVIHGSADPLVDPSGGRRTAEVIPGAELMVLEGMGHDLPVHYWPTVIEAITGLAARSAAVA